jgi:hypothetical protein
MTNEDLHRWTISKELERPDVADVMAEARRHIAALPAPAKPPSIAPWRDPQNVAFRQQTGAINTTQGLQHPPRSRGALSWLLGD